MKIGTKTLATGVAALALTATAAAVGVAGVATSASADPHPAAGEHQGKGQGLGLGRMLHGDAVVKKGDQLLTVQRQRGEVTAVSDSSITVKSEDGFEATYGIDQNTKVRKARQDAALSDIKTGAKVRVVGIKEGDNLRAVLIGTGNPGGRGQSGAPGGGAAAPSSSA